MSFDVSSIAVIAPVPNSARKPKSMRRSSVFAVVKASFFSLTTPSKFFTVESPMRRNAPMRRS